MHPTAGPPIRWPEWAVHDLRAAARTRAGEMQMAALGSRMVVAHVAPADARLPSDPPCFAFPRSELRAAP
jgi:hypothetical protein